MAGNLQNLAGLLQATLDPSQSKQAESTIRQQEETAGFSLNLLQLVASDAFPMTTKLAGALFFKNFVKRNWVDLEGAHKLPEDETVAIKRELVGLMISTPPAIQAQLEATISVIAESDFYERWDSLVDDLVSRLTLDNPKTNNGVLRVAHSVFKKWRPLYRSDALFTEINHVLNKFAEPFLQFLQRIDEIIDQNKNNKVVLEENFDTLIVMFKLFFDLSCQDLPPQFEDNYGNLTTILKKYLQYDNPLLHTDDESEPGKLEFTKAEIFDVLSLYKAKYSEVLEGHLEHFVEPAWTLLSTVGTDTKYDVLVSRALSFLTAVVSDAKYAQTFSQPGTLSQVVEKVILPNLSLRESDIELFEDEPIEFIRRDLEGSDSETRRRAATDFLRALMEKFEEIGTQVVTEYVNHFLGEYAKNPSENWKSKDTAIYLFSAIASKGTTTAARGVQTTNPRVNILNFFEENIASDLSADDVHVIVKVDAIKFAYVFRSQLGGLWQTAFPLVVKHLGSSHYVVYTYAAIAVERVLLLTNEDKQPIISRETVTGLSKELLEHIFKLMASNAAPEKVQENEFLMKTVMRVLFVAKDGVAPIAEQTLDNLVAILGIIRQNPSNPRFYYYFFESIGALIKYAGPSSPEKYEAKLFEPFSLVLANEVQEFEPYVFQLFAALLDINATQDLPKWYEDFITAILQPKLWDSKGNVPALVRLLISTVSRGRTIIVSKGLLEGILGIFQKLNASKATEQYAFDLIETIYTSIPEEYLTPYSSQVIGLMLTRLQSFKTEQYQLRFTRFYHHIAARGDQGLGADYFILQCDKCQQDIFRQLYTHFILQDTQKLSRTFDRKTAVVSLTKTLADSEAFIERYQKGWALTCEALLKLLVNPPVPHAADVILIERDIDEIGFSAGFTALSTCARPATDPFPQISDVRVWTGQYLKDADQKYGGRISGFVQNRLSEEARKVLIEYMS